MIDRLTSKRAVLFLMILSASVVLVSGSREWVSGSVEDAVLGSGALHGSGSDIAPGVIAAALVGMAAAVTAATSGTIVRVVAASAALLAAGLGSALVIAVLADPGGALGTLAAAGTGRSGTLAAGGRVGSWAWVALAAMIFMGIGALGALVGGRGWSKLPSRYDAPVAGEASRRSSPNRPTPGQGSAWEQLSRGEDPTAHTRQPVQQRLAESPPEAPSHPEGPIPY